jgi:hypothetical protein
LNNLADKPSEMHQKFENKKQRKKDPLSDLDSKIPLIKKSIYEHYGKPNNIVHEKFTYYKGTSTPAGSHLGAWDDGGWQRGRFTVQVGYEEDGLKKRRIPDEGEGSWFFMTNGLSVKVYVGAKLDCVLELELGED